MVHVQSGRLYTGRLRGSLRLQSGRRISGQVGATRPVFLYLYRDSVWMCSAARVWEGV